MKSMTLEKNGRKPRKHRRSPKRVFKELKGLSAPGTRGDAENRCCG